MSSWNGEKFNNQRLGETFIHNERENGTRDLKIVQTGLSGDRGSHAVINQYGNPIYIREGDHVIADNRNGN